MSLELENKDYQRMTEMLPFLSGVTKLCLEQGYSPDVTQQIVKEAANGYCIKYYGQPLLDRWVEGLTKKANPMSMGQDLGVGAGMAPVGTDPNQLAKQQNGQTNSIEDPEDAALRSKPVPTNPFDFRNHPAVLQMQKRQKDLLKAKKKELEQSQAHTAGLF